MSRQNKANKNNYMQSGRLTPDEIARERHKQRVVDHDDKKIVNRPPRERESSRSRSAPEE